MFVDVVEGADAALEQNARRKGAKALGEEGGVVLQQASAKVEGDLDLVVGVAADAVADGELDGDLLVEAGPEHARGIDDDDAGVDGVAVLDLGDGGFVADVGHVSVEQRVHEGAFAHVGDA